MIKRIKKKIRTAIRVRAGISRGLWLCVLVGFVLAVAYVSIFLVSKSAKKPTAKKVRVYPPQEVVVKHCKAMLMDRIKEAASFVAGWPDKDKYIAAAKDVSEKLEWLEFTIGPVEILEWETIDEAHLVVVSELSHTIRNRSTGKIKTSPERGKNIPPWFVEKRKSTDGLRWFILTGPRFTQYALSLFDQPRKKVPDSATIILKRAIIVQVVSDDKIIRQRTVFWDEDVVSAVPQGLLPPHEIAVKAQTYNLMDRIEEALSFRADFPAEAEAREKAIEVLKSVRKLRQSLEQTLGPVEIRANETFDEATEVVVPVLSVKLRDQSSGKVNLVQDCADMVLGKQETAEGRRWRIIGVIPPLGPYASELANDPKASELTKKWLSIPRKKVPGSPTIILKRAVVIQIVSDGEVLSERTVFWNEDVVSGVPQGLLPPHEIAVKAQTYNLMDRIEESLAWSIEASKETFYPGEPVLLALSIRNPGEEKIEVFFGADGIEAFSIEIHDQNGR